MLWSCQLAEWCYLALCWPQVAKADVVIAGYESVMNDLQALKVGKGVRTRRAGYKAA